MAVRLEWKVTETGIELSVTTDSVVLHPHEWALIAGSVPPPIRRAMTLLQGLIESEEAWVTDTNTVAMVHSTVARLDEATTRALTLPDPVPFSLAVEGRGTLAQPDFRFDWWFIDGQGRPVIAPRLQGAFVRVGHREYLLSDPIYSVIDHIRRFNEAPPASVEERFLRWAEIRTLLPEDAKVDRYLQSMRVARATAFGLDVRLERNGEITFDPVLLYREESRQERDSAVAGSAEAATWHRVLPPADQEAFARRFRSFREGKLRYALPGGWYIAVDPLLRAALTVVRQKQEAPPEERRRFARNPYADLREPLLEEARKTLPRVDDQDVDDLLNHLFIETAEYSDRVYAIGLWTPKVVPWIQKAAEIWLPPEDGGILVGGVSIPIKPTQLEDLLSRVQEAIRRGHPSVAFEGHTIPADPSTLEALDRLKAEWTGSQHPETSYVSTPSSTSTSQETDGHASERTRDTGRTVLLVKDNLENLDYYASRHFHRAGEDRLPTSIRTKLAPHQVEALQWLKQHWILGSPGALLADDMGLGKTLEALSFLAWVQEAMETGDVPRAPFLIVAPTGLLKNWEDEHDRHLTPPGLGRRLRAHGTDLRGLKRALNIHGELHGGAPVLDIEEFRRSDWVLTTYETLRDYQHSFGSIRWSIIVYDETQKIKTPGALMTDAAKAMHADFILALTGTPVENRLADLWCIIDTVQPGLLKDLKSLFHEPRTRKSSSRYSASGQTEPLEMVSEHRVRGSVQQALKSFSQTYESTDAVESGALKSLKQMLDESEPEPPRRPKPMLRRLKSQHLPALPPKTDHLRPVVMAGEQLQHYNKVIAKAREAGVKDQNHILTILHSLRSVSFHPHVDQYDTMSDEDYIAASARLRATFEILDSVAERDEKALVFLESRLAQPVIQGLIQRRYRLPKPPLLINGDVAGSHRKQRVDEFQRHRGFDVMILSPRAGGVGLTLTAANHVIHLSRWWNPAVEDQATDRVYRIGQTKPVHVYYPLAVHPQYPGHSFDERLHDLLNKKRRLNQLFLVPGVLTERDFQELYGGAVLREASERETNG